MLVGGLVVCVVSESVVNERMLEWGDPIGGLTGALDAFEGPESGLLLALGPASGDGGGGKAL